MLTKNQQWPWLLLSAITVAVFILLMNLGIMLFVTDEYRKLVLIDVTYPLWDLYAVLGLLFAAHRSARYSRRLALAWTMLALAPLATGIGNGIWAVIELGQGSVPFPSWADIGYLAAYPCFLGGVFLLPTQRLEPSVRLKTALDMLIVMLAATLVFWRYLLDPTIASVHEEHLVGRIVALAYPLGDLLLFWTILMLLYRQVNIQRTGPLLLLAFAFGGGILVDSVYSFQEITDTYVSAGLFDITWVLIALLYGIAGVWQAIRGAPATTMVTSPAISPRLNPWLTYLPYGWAIAAYLVLELNETDEAFKGMTWLSWGVGLIIGLVMVRQLVTLSENHQQARGLHRNNQALQAEISERKRVEAQLAYDAMHDALTGLPNRVLFTDRLHHAIEFTKRRAKYHFSLLFLDLDHFKTVNDSLGHTIGDQLLIGVAQRLRLCLRAGDTVARLGGDEFVVLLEDTANGDDATATADRLLTTLQQPFNLSGCRVFTSASIGIITVITGYNRSDDVLRDADIAMYQAKTRGKARREVFSVNMRAQAQTRLELANDLRQVLERDELTLHYQPILALQSERLTGFEALLRWHHPQRGLVAPNEFIPIAEETGLIVPIGQWVLTEACRQLRKWQVNFPQTPPLTMSVNISGVQFAAPHFLDQATAILQECKLDPTTLRFELTESVWLNSTAEAVILLHTLTQMGVQLHIDDFGTGYSSLAYLQHFPVRTLKLDPVFLNKMEGDSNSKDLIRAVIAMAHDLGMEVVAEGVETIEQLNHLKQFGCNYGQGYLLSRPVDRTGIEQLLTNLGLDSATQPKSTATSSVVGGRLVAQLAEVN